MNHPTDLGNISDSDNGDADADGSCHFLVIIQYEAIKKVPINSLTRHFRSYAAVIPSDHDLPPTSFIMIAARWMWVFPLFSVTVLS